MSDHPSGVLTWSPAAGVVALLWAGTALATLWCVLLTVAGSDPPGRVLAGCAAVGLLIGALFGTRARPRLRADADGLTVRGLLATRHHPWPLVKRVHVVRVRRWGRQVCTLEVDTTTADGGERLLVFGRFDLADDPEDVAVRLHALRPGLES